MTIQSLPAPTEHVGAHDVWVVSDPQDTLYKQVVPEEVVSDRKRFVFLGDHGVAEFKSSAHFASKKAAQPRPSMIMRRYQTFPGRGDTSSTSARSLAVIAGSFCLVVLVSLGARHVQPSVFQRVPNPGVPLLTRSDSRVACEMTILESALEYASDSDNVE